MNLSVIIATMNRPHELQRCIESFVGQSILPDELIIVDDGNLNTEDVRRSIPGNIVFKYHRKAEPGLSASRNIGAKMADSEYILFLDDDVVLEPGYIEEIMKVYRDDKEKHIGAVSGVVVNRKKMPAFLKYWERFFLMSKGKQGAILPWSFYTRIESPGKILKTDWVPGGLSCFRREVFNEFQLYDFKVFGHSGRHGLADIEFSIKVSRKYELYVTPAARLYHYQPEQTPQRSFSAGYKQTFNYAVIFQRHGRKTLLNILCFCWATFGLILGNFGAVVVVRGKNEKRSRFNRALGNCAGIFNFMLHKCHLS